MIKTLIRWIPLIQGYKLNTDGSSIGNPGKSGTGGIIRDTKGEWIVGFVGNLHLANNIRAELTALIQGLKLALSRGLMPLEINTDCKELMNIIINDHPSYSNMLLDCRDLLRRLGSPQIHHSFRETNRVADALAREGSKTVQDNSFLCLDVPPLFVLDALEADKEGTFFVRLQKPILAPNVCNSYNSAEYSLTLLSERTALPIPCNDAY
ncbi:hypothetical protein KY290_022104 [Solanum tuberosum]|uniref:RNase H type-1 domain-containing protein n=1 Tax=Solanum tuberosum TaxID=4113 RepID=A0ABQ7V3H0_SOLTU|nr:hypothetical protein KY289_021238 [Solanum tuberosum]KAH0758611.1 hypothetical protein KY290_022104 [Solanum tuberosum]